jgi:hypothetical protein
MAEEQLLKQILAASRDLWDQPETRPAARENFAKMLACRTAALGAEVYASDSEEKRHYHTCKSRACPSCGCRRTILRQRDYRRSFRIFPMWEFVSPCPSRFGESFVKTDTFCTTYQRWAGVIQQWARVKRGVGIIVLVVPHSSAGT